MIFFSFIILPSNKCTSWNHVPITVGASTHGKLIPYPGKNVSFYGWYSHVKEKKNIKSTIKISYVLLICFLNNQFIENYFLLLTKA